MKKRLLVLFTATLLALGVLAGCGSKQAAEDKDRLARIKEAGEIIVALEGNWAPWSFHDENDALVGFDADVARAIAGKLGVEASFVEGDWDSLLAGLDASRYDLVVNGVEWSAERAEKYDFCEPYGYIRTALIVHKDNAEIKIFEDLKGKTTANSIASTYMTLAESYGASATGVDSLDQTLELVISGRVDATLNAEVSYYDYLKVHPDAALKVVALTEEASSVVIPTRKGADGDSLREAINAAIAELHEEGVLSDISVKYFGSDITKK